MENQIDILLNVSWWENFTRRYLKFDTIARILEISQEQVESHYDEREQLLEEAERYYHEHELPKVRKQLAEMKKEIPEGRELRRIFIAEKIGELKKRYFAKPTDILQRELKRWLFEAKIFTGKTSEITPEQIAHAREFPIAKLTEHRNFTAKCPFHNDKTPSMDIRKNFYFCYGCGETGDVIDFVMKKDGATFKQAVERLSATA